MHINLMVCTIWGSRLPRKSNLPLLQIPQLFQKSSHQINTQADRGKCVTLLEVFTAHAHCSIARETEKFYQDLTSVE